ncbi:uncharacterized protein [Hoplias malabaricus]|uniref:uncharacterized protein n=1 Tax=Hoplias malabaricus TaxID=27720 RepID=UPI0034630054
MKEYGDSLLSESENSYRLRPEDRGSPTQEPQEEYTNIAQRFVSPETDSGLCTSDQSRPPTGLSDTQRGTESSLPPEDLNGMTSASTSDNDVSLSNLHTVFSFTTGWQPDQLPKTMQNMQENPNSQKATAGLHTLGEDRLWVQEGATLHSPLLQEPSQEGQSALTQKPLATEKQIRGQFSLCSCPNSEAISALQYEVSCLKRALDESLCHLSHPGVRTEPRSSVCSQEKRLRTRPRVRHRHRTNSSRCPTADTSLQEEDWSSSDVELSKHKGIDSRDSDNSEIPASYSRTHKGTRTHCRSPSSRTLQDLKCSSKTSLESLSQETSQSKPGKHHLRATVGSGSNVSIRSLTGHISDGCIGPLCNNRRAADRPTHHSRKAATVPVWDDHGGHGSVVLTIHKSRDSSVYRQPDEYLRSRNRHHYLPPHPHGKPLLQTNYGSCNSLPPGFKVWDQQSDSEVSSRRRSTQSDSAMLPANVYFQRTSPVPNTPGRSRARPWGQRASKEEAINKTLDKALEVALLMKKTTDRMAKTLSADLAKARIYKTVTRDPTCQ